MATTRRKHHQLAEEVHRVVNAFGPEQYEELLKLPAFRTLAAQVTTDEKLTDSVIDLLEDLDPADYHKVLEAVAYRRPWRPKRTGWTNVFDQFAHVVYGFGVFLAIVAWPSYWTAAISGFLLGASREVEQFTNIDLRILMFWDRLTDAASFSLGVVLLYHFLGAEVRP
jgi:hypothetical protein